MKKIKYALLLILIFIMSTSVFATTDESILLESFNENFEKTILFSGYSNLLVDETMDRNIIKLGQEHRLFNIDSNYNLIYEDMYIREVKYKDKEIADIIYTRDMYGKIVVVSTRINYADEKYDVFLEEVYNYLNQDERENACIYMGSYHGNLVVAAFGINDKELKIVIDDAGIFDSTGYKDENIRIIDRDRFDEALRDVVNKSTALDITTAIFIISIVGLILNLFILYIHSIDKINAKEVKKVVKIHREEEKRLEKKSKKNVKTTKEPKKK